MTQKAKSDDAVKITIWVCALFVLYPLSTGPTWWLHEKLGTSTAVGRLYDRARDLFYTPLDWVLETSDTAGYAVQTYRRLWQP